MKKLITVLTILLCFTAQAWAVDPIDLSRSYARMGVIGVAGAGVTAATTNYCNDASAVACYYMNGAYGGDGSEAETDQTSHTNDLAVTASDTMPDADDRPSGYSGRSRTFTHSQNDGLYQNDGEEVDINGADAKISITAWVKPGTLASGQEYMIVSKWGGAGNRQYVFELKGTGTNTFSVSCSLSNDGTAAVEALSTTTNYASGSWYHVACVANDTDIRVYVAGNLASSATAHTAGIYNSISVFFVGTYSTSYGGFEGQIDDVGVFSRELSSTEVAAIYANGLTGNKGGSD